MTVVGDLADAKNDAAAADKDRKALLAIRKLRREIERLEYKQREPIAIVGLSCRVPGARDADEFWALLDGGVDAISEVPPERWDVDEYYDPDPDAPGKVYTRRAGYVGDVADFDAAFFGISPGEAEFMDPQQRLLLEHAWCALEHAGIAPRTLYGTRTGVFVGVTACDYGMMIQEAGIEPGPYYITGNTLNVAAGRLAYVLRLQGPALAIDTACSSSLVAVHQACASLRSGESDVALAGGVNLLLSPQSTIATCRAHMLSADGRCKAFDSRADGFARGEGCGIVVLKRQSDAERDRDRILALIVGSAVNQDGRSSGLTVPNGPAQARVIADALTRAQLAPADVNYLEAHGTGTSLGDPIEVQSAAHALGAGRTASNALLLGSAKTNIGHLEAAAGIAGLIKVVLSLEHERLPRHLHFHEPNPHIPWDELPVEVVAQARAWPRGERARIAGVNSFGFSGTNAHVLVKEAPAVSSANDAATAPVGRGHWLLVLSGRTASALRQSAADYRSWLERHENASLADVCYTANTGRNHFEHRGVLVFSSAEQLREELAALATDGAVDGLYVGGGRRAIAKPKVGFLFTGQGAQYSGMGRRLYETEPVYREHFDRCATELGRLRPGEPDLRDVVFGKADPALLDQTAYTQPALYALEASLVALWRSWGVEPDIVLGHSVGEYAASFAAGVFDLEAGLRLIAERSRLMQALPTGGAMAAIQGKRELIEARAAEVEGVCIGAFNGANVALSGPEPAVSAVMERLAADGCRCTRLKTSHAFHSALMDPMLEPFRAFASGIAYRPPRVKLVSNVTGRVLEAGTIPNASYWTEHVRAPVRFADGIDALRALGCGVVLEIGPHPVLTTMGQQCWSSSELSGNDEAEPMWIGSLRREHDDGAEMLGAAAKLVVTGVELDFAAMEGEALSVRRRIALPTYPFQRQRHWLDAAFGERQRRPTLERLFYELRWREAEPVRTAGSRFAGRTWLILAPAAGLGTALRRRLEALGARVVLADCADDPSAMPARVAGSIEEATTVDSRPLAGVVHLWAADGEEPQDFAGLQSAHERGVLSALAVAHRLLAQQNEVALWLITRGVHRIVDGDGVSATQGSLWGFGRSVALGYPRIWGGLLDLPLIGDADALADEIVKALGAHDGEDHVALRDGRRWVARLEPAAARQLHGKLSLDPARTYLITGGLGAIGLQVAARLVERGARHLVLTARRPPAADANEVVRQLQNKGCQVATYEVDIGREADVSRLFDAIESSHLPALAGIFHFAGVTRIRSLEQVSHDDFVEVMAAKVWGGWLLDREARVRGIELALFVCASSTASAWGAPYQADYAAANAYLDALMGRRHAEGLSGCAIQFGPWRGAGMAVDQDTFDQLERMGFRLFRPSVALDAMEAIVASGAEQMAAVDVDWRTLKPLLEVQKPWPLLESLAEVRRGVAAGSTDLARSEELDRLQSSSEEERAQLLAMTIRTEAARVLGVPPESIADDASLLELGLDSLMAVDLIGRLRQRLRTIRFSPQLVYGHPTVSALASALASQIAPGETHRADTEPLLGDGSNAPPSLSSVPHRAIAPEGVQYRVSDGPVYTYRRYREHDRAGAILSYANSFGQKTANVLDSTFEWKYLKSPVAAGGAPIVHVLECGTEVVGFSGTVPARFKIDDDTMPGVWSTDTHVAPGHRTVTGWFLHQVDAHTADINLGIPNAAMYPIASATEAVIDLDRYENLKACLDLGGVLTSRGANALLASVSGLVFSPIPRVFDLYARLRAEPGLSVTQVPRFDETFDALWQVVSRDYPGIMVRDQSFLSWRFDRCPNREYTRYVARRNGAAVGYMVTREIRWRGTRRGRIVDYLVSREDSAAFDALIRKAMNDFRSHGVVSVTCAVASTQRQHIRTLRRHGFLHAEPGARVVASRLSHGKKLAAITNWFFTSADADADYNEDESET